MYSYSAPSPFEYSSTSVDRNVADKKLAEGVALLSPEPSSVEVMKDINRAMWSTHIGQKTILELRMDNNNIPEADRRIARVTEEDSREISLQNIRKLMPKIDRNLSADDARRVFLAKRSAIVNEVGFKKGTPEEQLNSFKDFLKTNLLKDIIKDKINPSLDEIAKQEFLADSIAHNFHQSGIAKAVESYYFLKTGPQVISDPSFSDSEKAYANQLTAPKSTVTLSCQGDKVTFDYALSYSNISLINKGRLIEPGGDLSKAGTKDKEPIVEVKSKIHLSVIEVKAGPDASKPGLLLEPEDLIIKKRFVRDIKGIPVPIVNSFLSKLFDDPLSGKAGAALLPTPPDLKNCEKQKLYIFFDKKGTLKYGGLDHGGEMITGAVPTKKLAQKAPKLSLRGIDANAVLTAEQKETAEDTNSPIIFRSGKHFVIHCQSNGRWGQTYLAKTSDAEHDVLDKFVTGQQRTRSENALLFKIVKKHHTNPKDQSPQDTIKILKEIAKTHPDELTKKQKRAWDTMHYAITTTQYTPPNRIQTFMSKFFISKKEGAAVKQPKSEAPAIDSNLEAKASSKSPRRGGSRHS